MFRHLGERGEQVLVDVELRGEGVVVH